jgi:hypothetical protein
MKGSRFESGRRLSQNPLETAGFFVAEFRTLTRPWLQNQRLWLQQTSAARLPSRNRLSPAVRSQRKEGPYDEHLKLERLDGRPAEPPTIETTELV